MSQYNKVKQIFLDIELMEELNKITGLDAFETDNWCDFYTIEQLRSTKLTEQITQEIYNDLKNKTIDYIVFRLDR